MMRVFLDANVLFSGSNSGSAMESLVALILSKATAVTSDFALEEARRNIQIKRPQWVDRFEAICQSTDFVPSASFPLSVLLAPKDLPILCVAIKSSCKFLVTGDRRNFGHLFGQTIRGVTILNPDAMADKLIP